MFIVIIGYYVHVMFTRIMKQKNKDGSVREYLYIVENARINGKTQQKVVANLGRVDQDFKQERIDSLIDSLSKYGKKAELVKLGRDMNTKTSKTYGEVVIFRRLWQELKLDKFLREYFKQTNKEVDFVEAIFAMVCNRLIEPGSKRETSIWIEDVHEPKWEQLELHHFYRAMDFLAENKEGLEQDLFIAVRDLFNCSVNVVMFDTTSVSYWGEGKTDLLQYGIAKNKRNDLKQLVESLI